MAAVTGVVHGLGQRPALLQSSDSAMREAANKLEANFVAEMLKSAGFGKSRDSFSGGAGEDGFASFLVQAQADLIVKAGGFGLAESIYNALKIKGEPDV
jgi:peptidoglycan hydrolase FlgJ